MRQVLSSTPPAGSPWAYALVRVEVDLARQTGLVGRPLSPSLMLQVHFGSRKQQTVVASSIDLARSDDVYVSRFDVSDQSNQWWCRYRPVRSRYPYADGLG